MGTPFGRYASDHDAASRGNEPVLVVDVGSSNLRLASCRDGRVDLLRSMPTPTTPFAEAKALLREMIREEIDALKPRSVHVSAAGLVDVDSVRWVRLHGAVERWDWRELVDLPVVVVNDGVAAAIAELKAGGLKGCRKGLAVHLGTGPATGLVLAGRAFPVELHMLKVENRLLEDHTAFLAGGSGIGWLAERLAAESPDSLLARALNAAAEKRLSGAEVSRLALAGCPVAAEAFALAGEAAGQMITEATALFLLDRVVVGGPVLAENYAAFERGLNRHFAAVSERRRHAWETMKPSVLRTRLENATILGAALATEEDAKAAAVKVADDP